MSKIENLATLIRYHRSLYYNQQPSITDAAFDALVDQVRKESPNHPVLSEVGCHVDDSSPWEKIEHDQLTGSQSKVTSADEFHHWLHSVNIQTAEAFITLAVDPKLDGVDLSLQYENGMLIHALTRGDGFVGEDILRNAIKMRNVPHQIVEKDPVTVRGQMMIDRETFLTISSQYKNARNACAGISRRLDGQQSNLISFIAFDCDGSKFGDIETKTEMSRHRWLKTSGFQPVDRTFVTSEEALFKEIEQWSSKRPNYPLEMDGLVIRIDDLQIQHALGYKQNCPVGQVAWKFASETGATRVVDIVWQPSKGSDSGRITPKAVLDPVDVLGVTITHATLNNEEFMNALGVSVGALVTVARANDVIPQIVSVTQPGTGRTMRPFHCPTCRTNLITRHKDLVCPNALCRDKILARVQRWVNVTDMLGVGEKIVELLISSNKVVSPADLYRLKVDDLAQLERMGKKSATKMVDSIHSRRSLPLGRFIDALGIADVGESTIAPLIAAGYDTLTKLRTVSENDLLKVRGIGPDTASKIHQGLTGLEAIIDDLLSVGVKVVEPKLEGMLKGKSFCFTGAVTSINETTGKRYTRKELQEIVVREGGIVKDSVSTGLDFLVQADPSSTSAKSQKALSLGTKVIGDTDFLALVENKKRV